MRNMLMVLATAVSMALLVCAVAVADSYTADFEAPPFTLGSVNGQDANGLNRWKSAPPVPHANWPAGSPNGEYDQRVVANSLLNPRPPAAFGQQSLRMSNAYTSGEFTYQTYSRAVYSAAGEDRSNTEYTAGFSFISKTPNAQQPGLAMSVSPDSFEGSRMSWVGLTDTPAGITVTVSDAPDEDGEFVDYPAGVLERKVPHTIRFRIKVNPGPDNDLVRIAIDNRDVGQCFTTWENYYRTAPEQAPPPNVNTPADINSLQFRLGGAAVPALLGGGFLFDNVTITTANGPGPAGCPDGGEPGEGIDIDKTTQTRSAFPGQLIRYRITVRNRGDAPVRGLRACDRAPRALRFVGATTRLQRATRRRLCLTIRLLRPGQRKTFRATFRLRQNVTAATVTNGASADIPTASAPSPLPPEGAGIPTRRRRVDRDAATTRVRSAARACPAAMNPRAHAAC